MSTTPPASGSRGPTPPPGGGASPLVIGKQFLKAYYGMLSTKPENIVRFYKPFSVLSQGEGSTPSTPATLTSYEDGLRLKDRLAPVEGARFDLQHGAIDAQESVGGGVLLVVTGHMVLDSQSLRRMFCHTFFLVPVDPNAKKRNYYIHNDVLRFINQEELPALEEKEEPAAAKQAEPSPPDSPEKETPSPAAPVEEPALANDQAKEVAEEQLKPVAVQESKEEPPEVHGVEETKDEPPLEEEPAAPKDAAPKEKSKKDKRSRGGRGKSRSSSPNESKKASATPKPNSWASLVAAGGAPPSGGQVKPKHSPPKESKPSTAAATETSAKDSAPEPSTTTTTNKDQQQQHSRQHSNRPLKRDPENTLVVKNISDSTKEADVRGMFEPLCAPTKARILGITVAGHRGLAFVDYDSPGPVALALEKQQKERFRLNGRNLDVEQKSLDRVKKSGSRGYRSGSPGNGGRYRDRKSGRGGDRSGRGGRGGR